MPKIGANRSTIVDRGDPAAPDFTIGDFTTDANWHDLDLSAIVPKGAVAVILSIVLVDDAAGSNISFRKNGNANMWNASGAIVPDANVPGGGGCIVFLDKDLICEYCTTNTVFDVIAVTVCGWFIP